MYGATRCAKVRRDEPHSHLCPATALDPTTCNSARMHVTHQVHRYPSIHHENKAILDWHRGAHFYFFQEDDSPEDISRTA